MDEGKEKKTGDPSQNSKGIIQRKEGIIRFIQLPSCLFLARSNFLSPKDSAAKLRSKCSLVGQATAGKRSVILPLFGGEQWIGGLKEPCKPGSNMNLGSHNGALKCVVHRCGH